MDIGNKTYMDIGDKQMILDVGDNSNRRGNGMNDTNMGNNISVGNNRNNRNTRQRNNRSNNEVENGYLRGNNSGNLGMPGYSYLDPQFWDMPKKRTPVCINTPDGKRKPSSLNPAGYLSGGNADVMEFTSVGSILPSFSYNVNSESIPDKTNRL